MTDLTEAAHTEIHRLCAGGRWQMTIPVNEQRDSDMILSRALDDLAAQRDAARDIAAALEAQLARVQELLGDRATDCQRFGLDCSDVMGPDLWCHPCRLRAAFEGDA